MSVLSLMHEQGQKIYRLCHHYGISNPSDAMWMDEFTWGNGRFDILTVCLASWLVRGFEVKIDRKDFLGDQKWRNYLPYVNLFYFATVPGVIEPGELPAEVGHLELLGKELVLKKRPKKLQPQFVRHTYGELFVTRLLLQFIRNLNYRDARINQACRECGAKISPGDPRMRAEDVLDWREVTEGRHTHVPNIPAGDKI